MEINDCIEGADAMFHALLIVIGILVGVLAEMYIVKHKLNERERNK